MPKASERAFNATSKLSKTCLLWVKEPRELLAAKVASRGQRGKAAAPIRELGEHPDGWVWLMFDGKMPAPMKWEKINATISTRSRLLDLNAGSRSHTDRRTQQNLVKAARKAPAKKNAAGKETNSQEPQSKKPAAKKKLRRKKGPAKKLRPRNQQQTPGCATSSNNAAAQQFIDTPVLAPINRA
jgi:DNA topoisomerase-1